MNATRHGARTTLTTPLPLAVSASDLAADVEPGEFVELEIDGSVTTCNAMVPPGEGTLGNILEFVDEELWEATDREIYIMGERRTYQVGDKQFVKYTEATNSWTILERPPFNTGFHGHDHGAIDPARRTYYSAMTGTAGRV